MHRDRYREIKELVERALEVPADRRERFLDEACGPDRDLRAQVSSLLSYDLTGAQDDPDAEAAGDVVGMPSLTGTDLGRFRIGEPLGSGGMGVVYLAEQTAPVKIRAAVKVIKIGMDTREVIARFEAERQALAMMDHPNIARVLDAGATAEGRPYFAMEYIDGPPLTAYCDLHRLGLRQRLALFAAVCRGVQHAHQRGVIHRDLKPGNILVAEQDGRPVPKIIDFGVARATELLRDGRTVFTRQGRPIGTPEYMSPEQADPQSGVVDTRSDVYSLGVVLYELLTGAPPFTRRDILRAHLRGAEPPRPSTRLYQASTDARRARQPDAGDTRLLARHVRGELDWVTMRALEKERERRYRSAAELADDVERYLGNQPVTSGPPSALYRMRKFARRHRLGVAMGVLLALAILAGGVGTSVGMIRARRAEREAVSAACRAEAASLYHAARNHPVPSFALAHLLRAIELDDRLQYRDQMRRLLLQSDPVWRLPPAENAHNPHAVDISPDGRWLAVGWSEGGAVQLYDRRTADSAALLTGHRDDVRQVRFSGDSRYLATAASDSTVRIWSPGAPEPIRVIRLAGLPFIFVDDAADRLITAESAAGRPLSFRAWRWDGGPASELGCAGPVPTEPWPEAAPQIDRSGRWLALAVGDHVDIHEVRDLAAGCVRSLPCRGAEVVATAFSPDSRRCVSLDDRHGVLIWDLEKDTDEPERRLQSAERSFSAAFSTDGRRLAVCGTGGLQVWDLDLPAAAAPRLLVASQWAFAAVFDPVQPWIVSIGSNKLVGAWPTTATLPIALRLATGRNAATAFSRDGRWLVTASDVGIVQAWPLDGTTVGEPRTLLHREGYLFERLRIDEASRFVYAATCNGEEGVRELLRLSLADGAVRTWSDIACGFELDAGNRYLAVEADQGVGDRHAMILDLESGVRRRLAAPGEGATMPIGFLADGRLLAVGPAGLGVWDPVGGAGEILRRDWPGGKLAGDRETLLTVGPDGRAFLGRYDDPAPRPLGVWFARTDPECLALDARGELAASCMGTDLLEVVDIVGAVHHRLPLFQSLGYEVSIDPAGRWLAAGGDGLVMLVPLPLAAPWDGLSHEALLSRLRGATNLRVERDETLIEGYRMVGFSVPDWSRPPRW